MVPTRVSQRRDRYPLRRLVRSGLTTRYEAPHTRSASAPISPSAKLRTISRSRSLPPVSSCLRNHTNASMLLSITAFLLTVACTFP